MKDILTCVKVLWRNPDNNYKPEVEIIIDEQAAAKYESNSIYISRLRCNSKEEAIKEGKEFFIKHAIKPLKSD